jgi:hypothetical protein
MACYRVNVTITGRGCSIGGVCFRLLLVELHPWKSSVGRQIVFRRCARRRHLCVISCLYTCSITGSVIFESLIEQCFCVRRKVHRYFLVPCCYCLLTSAYETDFVVFFALSVVIIRRSNVKRWRENVIWKVILRHVTCYRGLNDAVSTVPQVAESVARSCRNLVAGRQFSVAAGDHATVVLVYPLRGIVIAIEL